MKLEGGKPCGKCQERGLRNTGTVCPARAEAAWGRHPAAGSEKRRRLYKIYRALQRLPVGKIYDGRPGKGRTHEAYRSHTGGEAAGRSQP